MRATVWVFCWFVCFFYFLCFLFFCIPNKRLLNEPYAELNLISAFVFNMGGNAIVVLWTVQRMWAIQLSKAKTKLHPFPLLFSFSSQISLTEKPAITLPTVDLIGIWSIQGYTLSNRCLRFFLRQFTCAEAWNTVCVCPFSFFVKAWLNRNMWMVFNHDFIPYHSINTSCTLLLFFFPPLYKSELTKTKQ